MLTEDQIGQVQIEKKQIFPFSISNYMTRIVLPKCVIAHGGIIASVYFQIAFNINNQERAKSWQQQKCWKDPNKIASEIGCNSRKAKHAMKQLIQVGLIEESFHGKLRMFKLAGDKIYQIQELSDFLNEIEKKIIASVHPSKMKDLRDEIVNFNKINDIPAVDLLRRNHVSDISLIRELFLCAEQIYKGSSLFCMNVLEIKLKSSKKNDQIFNILNYISLNQSPVLFGCSQATLNRYIYDYQNHNASERLNLILNQFSGNQVEELNIQEGVVNKMSNSNYYCPICKQNFESGRSIGMHLSKAKDEDHSNFNQLRKDHRCPYEGFKNLFEEHISMFSVPVEIVVEKPQKKITDEYMKIPCDCKTSCKECHVDWLEDFFKGCNHPRKSAFISEYEIGEKKEEVKKVVTASKKVKEVKETEEVEFKELPENKKQVNHGQDTAPGLLKFFYDLTGTKSVNWGKECGQIKTQLNKGISPDQVRVVFKHMHRKGQVDIRFFVTSINDALLEEKCVNEMEQEGTAAYLVKYFYTGHKLPVNLQTLVKDVQKIQETLNSGLTYEQTKLVLDYMISTKCTVINFIASKRTEALSRQGGKTDSPVASKFKSNPSFFDQSELNIVRDELAGARIRLPKVKEDLKEAAIEECKRLLRERKFTTRYTAFEWAWRIGLELDTELYQLGLKEINKETYINFALRNGNLDTESTEKMTKLKSRYESWLNEQHKLFSKNNITTVN